MTSARAKAPFAEDQFTHAGWTIYCERDGYGRGQDDWFAIHQDSGEVRDIDVTGRRQFGTDWLQHHRNIRLLAELGFPGRVNGWPLTTEEIAEMHAARFAQAAE